MQSSLAHFLAFLTAHVLGDFVFQTNRMIEGKAHHEWKAYLSHGVVHLLVAYFAVLLFTPELLFQPWLHPGMLLYIALHLGVDRLKQGFQSRLERHWRPLPFLTDQIVHITFIVLLVGLLNDAMPAWLLDLHAWIFCRRESILWLVAVYAVTMFGGGYLIPHLLPAADRLIVPGHASRSHDADSNDLSPWEDGVQKGGMYIGWLERFVTLTAVLAKSPALIGLILTAKSIIRFKKLDRPHFAEYYLLGTFLSLALALAGGLFLLHVLGGEVITALD